MSEAIYRRQLLGIEAVPPHDELVQGYGGMSQISDIVISQAGEYKRGLLLMSSSNEFIPATADGMSSATELCILVDDVTVSDGEAAKTAGYFGGEFKASCIRLAYETEDDDHDELLLAIAPVLRQHGIYTR